MVFYAKTPEVSIKILPEVINKFSKVAGYKANRQKSVAFLYNDNEQSQRK